MFAKLLTLKHLRRQRNMKISARLKWRTGRMRLAISTLQSSLIMELNPSLDRVRHLKMRYFSPPSSKVFLIHLTLTNSQTVTPPFYNLWSSYITLWTDLLPCNVNIAMRECLLLGLLKRWPKCSPFLCAIIFLIVKTHLPKLWLQWKSKWETYFTNHRRL